MNALDDLPEVAQQDQPSFPEGTESVPTQNTPPESDIPLPYDSDSIPPDISQDQYPDGVQEGMGSVMANPSDLYRYQHAISNGMTPKEALRIGDSGIGRWGDITATYKTPMVAFPASYPGLKPGSLVKVTGPNGEVAAKVADTWDDTDRSDQISVNPATALAIGHPGGMTKLKWEHLTSGDVSQNPQLAGPPKPMSSRTSLGAVTGEPFALDPNAKPVGKNSDGTTKWSDGWNVDAKSRTAYKDVGGERFYRFANGTIKQMGKSDAGPEEKAKEASDVDFSKLTGKTRANFASDQEYQAAKEEALSAKVKPRIYRDTNTGIAFDISDIKNPKPIDLPGNPASIDISKITPGDWNSVPEDVRDVAKNIANYSYPKLSGFALRSPYFQQMFKVISKVDPTFDYKNYDARQRFLTDFSGSGKIGQNILSFDTALDHMGRALEKSEVMAQEEKSQGMQSPVRLKAFWGGKSGLEGDPRPNNYETDAGTLVNEYARAVGGQAGTDTEKKSWENKLIGGNLTYRNAEQRRQAMNEMAHNLGSRLGEIEQQYKRTMGKDLDVSLLSPEAEATLTKVGATDIVSKYGSGGGKKPYMDPSQNNFSVNPFPGAIDVKGEQPTGNLPVFHDPTTNQNFIQSPDGSMVPYSGEYTPGTP